MRRRLWWSLLQVLILPTWVESFLLTCTSSQVRRARSSALQSVLKHRKNDADAFTNIAIKVPQHYKSHSEGYPSKLHYVHVQTVLSDEEASTCLDLAQRYGQFTGKWNKPDDLRHTNYATCDFAIEEAHQLLNYLEQIRFTDRMWDCLSLAFDIDGEDLLGYIDFFCVRYVASGEDHQDAMDRLQEHRDGSILSFSVLLTPPSDFEGGGTSFDALRDVQDDSYASVLHSGGIVRPPRAGDVTLHSGKLFHGADVVTKGKRVVLVGFVDVAEWCLRPGVLGEAAKNFGRMDVAAKRYEQQLLMTTNGSQTSWKARNTKWLPRRSCFNQVLPALDSVVERASSSFQRQNKLETEDLLLRFILERREA